MTAEVYTESKDPLDVTDWVFNWADSDGVSNEADGDGWLKSDTISSSSWTIEGYDTVLVQDSDTATLTKATIWVSAGTEGVTYRLENTIITAGGRTKKRTLFLTIEQE